MDKSISIQSVLYQCDPAGLQTFVDCLLGLRVPQGLVASVRFGDCTTEPLPTNLTQKWQSDFASRSITFSYTHFGGNLGFGGGQNRLAEQSESDLILTLNPDTVFTNDLVAVLFDFAKAQRGYGIVEARQFPLEHPKEWNTVDFTTEWCSGCCALFDGNAFRSAKGFDPIFFLYCEDVDLSWRIRALGHGAYFCPAAGVYHRKRLLTNGVETGQTERIWGLVGLMVLLAKYRQTKLLGKLRSGLISGNDERAEECLIKFDSIAASIMPATREERRQSTFLWSCSLGYNRWKY